MIDRERLSAFLELESLAFLGASRNGRKFGNHLIRALRERGTRVLPVHPGAAQLEGLPTLRALEDLPVGVGGAVLVIKPTAVLAALPELAVAGISRVWVQQGGESPAAAAKARELGLELIQGQCLLMFLDQAGWFHRVHHRIAAWTGQVPA